MNQVLRASGADVRLTPQDSLETVLSKAADVRPTARQIAWQRDEISAFIHFGMNTFTDREWGDGTEDPRLFNPTNLDTRQWVRAAKAAGITRMILTAKHHDGFCLWPSKYTEHCVRNSPWKGGKGDVVGDFISACRAEGMHYGIYISPWDRHEKTYGDSPKYNQHFLDQLREVLTTYPGIEEVWFDGACGEGPNGKQQVYDWHAYWSLIRELAPDAVISVRGPDVRWCGNEAGHTRKSEWSVIPMPGDDQSWESSDKALSGYLRDIYGDDLGGRDALMRSRNDSAVLTWYPSQVNTSIRPGWFYHKGEDNRVRTLDDLLHVYYGSVGGNGQFLLNIPPDQRGLFHENDVARLKEFGEVLKGTFAHNLAEGAKLSAEVVGGKSVGDPAALLDGNPDTFWTTTDGAASASVTAEFAAPVRANCLMLREHIASGQRVEAFEVDVFADGQWHTAATDTVIGCKRLVRFDDATVSKVRVRFTQFRIRPTLAGMGLYFAPAILSGPKIDRDIIGTVTIKPPAGCGTRYTLDGTAPTDRSSTYTQPIPLPRGGVVIAQAFALTPGTDIASAGTLTTRVDYGPAKAKWKIIDCDSQNPGGAPQQAIDDSPDTMWHTRDQNGTDPMPHHISVDLGEATTVTGFTYTPRQDRWDNGIIMKARFEVSQDATTWTVAADDVNFDNVVNSRQQQVVNLKAPVEARYFRMTALRTVHDNNIASAADVSVLALGMLPAVGTSTPAAPGQADPPAQEKMTPVDAWAAVKLMSPGINIGNTLENTSAWETGWGQPPITREYVQTLARLGFKSVRLPVAWDTYADNGKITPKQFQRVSEVVGWITDAGMYCVINIHWDGGWINSGVKEKWPDACNTFTPEAERKFKSYWEQIAHFFAGKNEKLIFEGFSEESFDNAPRPYETQTRVGQLFIDTVRASGGNNATRFLLVPGYCTDSEKTSRPEFRLPKDTVPGKLLLSIHYYTPWQFVGLSEDASWGKMIPTWGSDADIKLLNEQFDRLNEFCKSHNIPAYIGEFSMCSKKEHESSVRWTNSVFSAARNRNMVPVLWDTGGALSRREPFKPTPELMEMLSIMKEPPASR